MSNIYLKVTIEKKWYSHNFNFLDLKNLSPGQFLGSYNPHRYYKGAKQYVAFLLF